MLGQGSGAKMGSIRRVLRGLRLEAGGKKHCAASTPRLKGQKPITPDNLYETSWNDE
jgi:hypothetical protein